MRTNEIPMPVAIFVCLVCLIGLGGWIANIYKLVTFVGDFGGMEIARAFIAPLGVILGFF